MDDSHRTVSEFTVFLPYFWTVVNIFIDVSVVIFGEMIHGMDRAHLALLGNSLKYTRKKLTAHPFKECWNSDVRYPT